jgi:hypothetical protein
MNQLGREGPNLLPLELVHVQREQGNRFLLAVQYNSVNLSLLVAELKLVPAQYESGNLFLLGTGPGKVLVPNLEPVSPWNQPLVALELVPLEVSSSFAGASFLLLRLLSFGTRAFPDRRRVCETQPESQSRN